ncbi:alpha-E domain-containing protein [Parvularcula dongshanensis]|uniref:Putative alpha-E superfamily protein n=1 Tax=Parvularcula dongshanensis TaxID=1173995 RepID=A0A840I4U3_9PROT|nr:alpha-E domain-containing protein [Parvularcula dongshanensis]MBB4659382.1 putative alpha-E superfamily protein [Parvularcula dongshanensis]
MLSRTAANLYWMSRYVERADATARLLTMGARMTMLPGAAARGDWQSVLQAAAAGMPEGDVIGRREAIRHLLLDGEGGSIRACLIRARANGRAERTALTSQMWEALNDDWRHLDTVTEAEASQHLPAYIDWAHRRAATFRGATETTMLRDDRYDFVRLGGQLERAAMTLRLLEVKYLALLPERDVIGGARDLYQWTALLLAASALRAYHHVYRGDYAPWNVADLLVLNREFPRSAAFCIERVRGALGRLEDRYGQRHACHDQVEALNARLAGVTMEQVFADGLHEFVTATLSEVLSLHATIGEAYDF